MITTNPACLAASVACSLTMPNCIQTTKVLPKEVLSWIACSMIGGTSSVFLKMSIMSMVFWISTGMLRRLL
jgi:hypothetical protein